MLNHVVACKMKLVSLGPSSQLQSITRRLRSARVQMMRAQALSHYNSCRYKMLRCKPSGVVYHVLQRVPRSGPGASCPLSEASPRRYRVSGPTIDLRCCAMTATTPAIPEPLAQRSAAENAGLARFQNTLHLLRDLGIRDRVKFKVRN